MTRKSFSNPFRPGAGHPPPFLAGRENEKEDFRNLLKQREITDNPIVTGLRGVGKTVLLDELKRIAINAGWYWVGTDMTEAASLSEERMALRMLADLSVVTSGFLIDKKQVSGIGLKPSIHERLTYLNFESLLEIYKSVPGLVSDKLKAILEIIARLVPTDKQGILFAYDEAQNLSEQKEKGEYPVSLLLDVFQSIQRKGIRFMMVLVGLPTLFPKLVEARTSAERMFHIITLKELDALASRDAIVKPIEKNGTVLPFSEALIDSIVRESGGYPYFIQFICREIYDAALQKIHEKGEVELISIPDITRKLDADFFAGRWERTTDRQRDLLRVIAHLESCDTEFSVQEVVEKSKVLEKAGDLEAGFNASHVNQMLATLTDRGFIFKNRHGRYSFAIPLLSRFIKRQMTEF